MLFQLMGTLISLSHNFSLKITCSLSEDFSAKMVLNSAIKYNAQRPTYILTDMDRVPSSFFNLDPCS